MRAKLAACFSLLLLGACVTQEEELKTLPKLVAIDLTNQQVATVKSGVAQALQGRSDPVFGPISGAREDENTYYACGVVNSKGSFNAYTGEKHFIARVTGNDFKLVAIGDADYQEGIALGLCREYGIL